eukprot:748337-Hanusia_phi.AAC.1
MEGEGRGGEGMEGEGRGWKERAGEGRRGQGMEGEGRGRKERAGAGRGWKESLGGRLIELGDDMRGGKHQNILPKGN